MKNKDKWQPSKYIYKKGKLVASRNSKEVCVGSRLVADLIASCYDRNLRKYAKGKLLDLGCGMVPLFKAYQEYVTDVTCVDWDNTMHKNEYLDLECDITKVLPFKNEVFDTIILSDVLEHIPQPEHLWREMSRVVTMNGKIIVNVPFFYWLHERPYDYYRFTEFALRRYVEDCGLKLVQLETIGGMPEIITDILSEQIQFIPLIGRPVAVIIQYTTWLFIKTALGKQISKKTGQQFPFGYFLVAEKVPN